MSTLMGDLKKLVQFETNNRRQAGLSGCLTEATLTQARLNLTSIRREDLISVGKRGKFEADTFQFEGIKTEQSPEGKLSSHSASSSTILLERATRPLPPPPFKESYMDQSWYHNVTRQQAISMITQQNIHGNHPKNGYFLIRPSTSNPSNPLTLVLWYEDRVYNVPVRKRNDNRYALGSSKANEKSFGSVEEIVPYYKEKELFLFTGGTQMGSTKLTETPSK